jgi:hypothetical protein
MITFMDKRERNGRLRGTRADDKGPEERARRPSRCRLIRAAFTNTRQSQGRQRAIPILLLAAEGSALDARSERPLSVPF